MADACHLERMGRELKCPICLSLLNSAVSLTCNHVFCNSCIYKAMRSGSNCPVCKVPYQRREIRPAPHMDNLVNIYKSMEFASGVPFLVTQNPPTTNFSDVEKQTEGDLDRKTPEIVKHQKTKLAQSKTLSRSKSKKAGRNRGKTSFSTNKRVQVPQSPITETPIREAKNEHGKNKIIDNIHKNSKSPSKHPTSNEKGSPLLSPFFWLREEEEDEERPSQQVDVDHLTGTPAKAPSFSDIKDSDDVDVDDDDDVPSKMCPKEELLRKCNKSDLFDSEMFEWTQRPCSPELCSSPNKMQSKKNKLGVLLSRIEPNLSPRRMRENSRDRVKSGKRVAEIGHPFSCRITFPILFGTNAEYDEMQKQEMDTPSKGAFTVTNREVVIEHLDNVIPLGNNTIRDNEHHDNSSSGRKSDDSQNGCETLPKRGRKSSKISQTKRQKKNADHVRDVDDGSNTPNDSVQGKGSLDAKLVNEVDDHVSELPASLGSKRGTSEDNNLKNSKRHKKIIEQSQRSDPVKRKRKKQSIAKSDITEKVIVSQEARCEHTVQKSNSSNSCKSKKHGRKLRRGIPTNDVSREKVVDGNEVDVHGEVNNVQEIPNNDDSRRSVKLGKVHPQEDIPALRKCETNSFKCAFCHSTEETEASGEMVHYSEGRPVSANHSVASVIHSHQKCTEWAPNVYFEDDIAVNLEEELVRSRRIKCSLCGLKGAALGCYEKSCRKSFHVPCAKLLKECRWDTDHFVILCPLHASSKLPCELSTSQVKKAKCNLKKKSLRQQSQAAIGRDTKPNSWNCGRPCEKMVLCCSALAPAEKEIISEFTKLSGVSVSKSWNPSVTHVIASEDENRACKRTLKVLMGILEGKWILSIKWVQACIKDMRLVEETPYEISCDTHGVKNGPCLGRLRLLNKQPKLFSGFKFYFTGDFVPSYKAFLQDLITAAGGIVLHRKPLSETHSMTSFIPPTVIIYSIELPDKCGLSKKDMILNNRRSEAQAIASSSGSKVANNSWLLNCIAGHKLLDL